jgi:hypothetical protein
MPPKLISLRAVAKEVGRCPRTIKNWVEAEQFPAPRFGADGTNRAWMFAAEDVDAAIKLGKTGKDRE